MSAETSAIRGKTRRVKNHIIDRYLKLADRVEANDELSENEKARYWELTTIFAKNVIPRSQEVTGDDGEPLEVTLIKYATDGNSNTLPVSTEGLPETPTSSV